MHIVKPILAAAVAMTCLVVVPTGATAQTQAPAAAEPAMPDLSDKKLDQMAAAVKQVATVRQDYQQRIATASPTDKERIADEANGALEKAVTDQGLSVDEFNSIMVVAQNDPDVLEKLRQRLRSPK